LETLTVTNNNLRDLGFQGVSNNLKILKVADNDIHKLFPSGYPGAYKPSVSTCFPNLAILDAKGNDISDVTGLASNCPNLRALNLEDNNLAGGIFDELCHLKNLEYVNLANNDIKANGKDFENFALLCSKNIKYLNVQNNNLSKSNLMSMRDKLKRRGISMEFLGDHGCAEPIVGMTVNPMGPSDGGASIVTVDAVAVAYVEK
jgi:uncharacterized protein YjbI with pentapeptide repeats